MIDTQQERCNKILNHYGFEAQREILVEECAELIQAISKLKRKGERTSENFLEELADVSIMIEQMKLAVSIMIEQMKLALSQDELIKFLAIQNRKIDRQILRIRQEVT